MDIMHLILKKSLVIKIRFVRESEWENTLQSFCVKNIENNEQKIWEIIKITRDGF